MKLYTIYYKIQAKHDEGKCQYDTHLNNYSRNFSVRQKIFRTDKTNQPVWPNDRQILWQFGTDCIWFPTWSPCRIICVSIKSNATGATNGAGTAYSSRAREFTLGFWWHLCYSISFLCNLLSTIVCLFVLFHLVIVLSVIVLSVFLQFMTSDYPFDIFKLVFILNNVVYLDILSSNNCIVYFMIFRSLKKIRM